MVLGSEIRGRLVDLGTAIIDQARAKIVVEPYERSTGFWFGGGNLVRDRSGRVLIVGRYRNRGDSRTGLQLGTRGLECVVWESPDGLSDYELVHKWTKADLTCQGQRVISIEGTALRLDNGNAEEGIELFISSEKERLYPVAYRDRQKPGTGIWSIDRISGDNVETLDPTTLQSILSTTRPADLHIKDPVVVDLVNGATPTTALVFCTHPYSWTSSNTAAAIRRPGEAAFGELQWNVLPRGNCWDVAATRVTDVLRVPRLGALAALPQINLYFYDGAECIHDHDKGESGTSSLCRPRGYSCEEIGGLAWGFDQSFPEMASLTTEKPLFISPLGTGCSRYVSTLVGDDGILATWQQSQADLSQPLVAHWLPMNQVERILA
jgi:hypothetical protein